MPRSYGFTPPELPEESILRMYGIEPPEEEEFTEEPYRGSFFETFAGLEGVPQREPTSFGEGLLGGLTRGLGVSGTRKAQARQTFERGQDKRRAEFDQRRRESKADYEKNRRTTLAGVGERQRAEAWKQKEYERDNPPVTADDLQRVPELAKAGYRVGDPVSRAFRDRLGMYAVEAPEREAAAAKSQAIANRAQATADRQAAAAERTVRIDTARTEAQLHDDWQQDKDVAGYRTATQNLSTMREAAKLRNGPGDLAMVIAYVRATEPGVLSVVREEEKRGVQMTVGRVSQIANLPAQWVKGNLLTEGARQEMLRSGESIARSQRSGYEKAREQYERRAGEFGVDPKTFLREYSHEGEQRWAPGTTQSRQGAPPKTTKADQDYVDSLNLEGRQGAPPKTTKADQDYVDSLNLEGR